LISRRKGQANKETVQKAEGRPCVLPICLLVKWVRQWHDKAVGIVLLRLQHGWTTSNAVV